MSMIVCPTICMNISTFSRIQKIYLKTSTKNTIYFLNLLNVFFLPLLNCINFKIGFFFLNLLIFLDNFIGTKFNDNK